MSNEEITTKLEITQNGSQKVVRVDFTRSKGWHRDTQPPSSTSNKEKTIILPTPLPRDEKAATRRDHRSGLLPFIDLNSPWVIRLIAVMAILLLSLLVL